MERDIAAEELDDFLTMCGGDIVAVWKAYIDDSGTHADSTFVLAGVVCGTVTTWKKLSPRWQKVLDDYGIPKYHGSEFRVRQGKSSVLTEENKDLCFDELVDKTRQVNLEWMTIVIRRSEFDLAMQSFPQYRLEPFDLLLSCSVLHLMHWRKNKPQLSSLSIIVDNVDKIRSKFYHGVSVGLQKQVLDETGELRRANIGTTSDSDALPMQVADLIAHLGYRYYTHHSTSDIETLEPFKKVVYQKPSTHYMLHSITAPRWIRETERLFPDALEKRS